MKKLFLLMVAFVLAIPNAFAKEERTFFISERNTYYQRSQHTYAFTGEDGIPHDSYAPSIYILLDDIRQATRDYDWNFISEYTVPWNIENNEYYVAYCADMDNAALDHAEYRRVTAEKSTYLTDEAKSRIIGILKNSYPYISETEMKKRLTDNGVLQKKNNVLAAKGNVDATRDITLDELVSATQMAINYYTNPGATDENYYSTYSLSGRSVLREYGNWYNEYSSGYYEAVNTNINAVTDYLITLSDEIPDDQKIAKVTASNLKGEVYVYLNNELSKQDEFNIIINENGSELGTFNLDKVSQREDGSFVLTGLQSTDLSKVRVSLDGTDHVENNLFVYESVVDPEYSQTLVGLSTSRLAVLDVYNDKIVLEEPVVEEIPNPNTGLSAIILPAGGLLVLLSGVYFICKKKDILF